MEKVYLGVFTIPLCIEATVFKKDDSFFVSESDVLGFRKLFKVIKKKNKEKIKFLCQIREFTFNLISENAVWLDETPKSSEN